MERLTINPKFPPCSRIVLAGPSNSGKSHLVSKILQFRHEVCSPIHPKKPDVLLYFYLVPDNDVHMKLREMFSKAVFTRGLENLEKVLSEHAEEAKESDIYLVVEDLMLAGTKHSETLSEVFLAHTHHLPICATLFTVQSLFHKNSSLPMLLRNSTALLFTGSNRLKSSLASFGRELEPRRPLALLAAFEECLSSKNDAFPYLVVDCLAKGLNDGMFRTGIFPGEALRIFRVAET